MARKRPSVVNILDKIPRKMLSLMFVRSKSAPAIGPINNAGAPSENARRATDEAEMFQETTGTVKIRKKSIHRERDDNPCKHSKDLAEGVIGRSPCAGICRS